MSNIFTNYKPYKDLVGNIKSNKFPIYLTGINKVSYVESVYNLYKELKRVAIIFNTDREALEFFDDIINFTENVTVLRKQEINFFDTYSHSHQIEWERVKSIYEILESESIIVLLSLESTLLRMSNPKIYSDFKLNLEVDKEIDFDELVSNLANYHYERVNFVEIKGQFSVKGGIIDIFPVFSEYPFRIEFFGDEVFSIRKFEPDTQRSIGEVNSITIRPFKEGLIVDNGKIISVSDINDKLNFHKNINDIYKYITVLSKDRFSIFDYLKDTVILLDAFNYKLKRIEEFKNSFDIMFNENILSGNVLSSQFELYMNSANWLNSLNNGKTIIFSEFFENISSLNIKSKIEFNFSTSPKYFGDFNLFVDDIKKFLLDKNRVFLYFKNINSANNIMNLLLDENVSVIFEEELTSDMRHNIVIISTKPSLGGYILKDEKVVVLTEYDILKKKYKAKLSSNKNLKKIKSFSDIDVGDYIVHETHGIGKYTGIFLMELDGEFKDMVKLEYKNGDMLYIPVDRMQTLHKYIGSDVENVRVDTLGSANWKKLSNRARKSIKNIASDLINLYSVRESTEGFSFSEDDIWQKEFEESFEYTETDDQLRCIAEIKRDMQSIKPMDRLLCGDVGYGKTEVAIRAIFKAVNNSKQAVFLVPTTILAEQHYKTICERFKDYPINVDVISRFKTKKNQSKTLENLEKGVTDVIVGTHRLLSKDVKFKDLGFLVIDEEQRFGVTHKEKIKNLKKNVDTLTLSATPIPRTLNMSLMKVRDLSLLEEAPENRYPIQTYVLEFDDSFIRNAILREIGRSGQVYFVHNRVDNIELIKIKLSRLVPEAKIVYAHGKMSSKELEKIILDFMDKKYDVLIATTIIETGVDIPNVNTIIINKSDTFGLSQLYQLRGRVGRSDKLAYAYLTYDKGKVLTDIGKKRLNAIKEFTDLGSGFKLSMRDLEIRGAGNLFGQEQHGHLVSIGYELYLKILNEEINKQKGIETVQTIDTKVEFHHSAYISDEYISDYRFKLDMYKKISSINGIEDMKNVKKELKDRFGVVPLPTINLIYISTIRSLASQNGFINIKEDLKNVKFIFDKNYKLNPKVAIALKSKYSQNTFRFVSGRNSYYIYTPNYLNDGEYEMDILYDVMVVLDKINELRKANESS